jgi:hypothetical protein
VRGIDVTKSDVFNALLLIARPAAGKSEIIDYLTRLSDTERRQSYHIGKFKVIDDFPMLWTWFEEDDILTRLGQPRLHTTPDGNFKSIYLWDLLIERICLDYIKFRRDHSQDDTAVIEFSRGSEHGGYHRAFHQLSETVLKDLAILYVDVPWEESLRKNRKRFNPDKPDSILEHGLSDEKLELLYRDNDWDAIIAEQPDFITIKGIQVPYAIFDNHDDVTTVRGPALGKRLKTCLDQLWQGYR